MAATAPAARKSILASLLFLTALFVSPNVQAQSLYNNLSFANDASDAYLGISVSGAQNWEALAFATTSQAATLSSITLRLGGAVSDGAITVDLFEDALYPGSQGSAPSNGLIGMPGSHISQLYSGSLSATGLPIDSAPVFHNIEFSGLGLTLTPNTIYWLAVEVPLDSAADFIWTTDDSWPNNGPAPSNDGVGPITWGEAYAIPGDNQWSATQVANDALRADIQTIPEPGGAALAILGGGVFLIRRRQTARR